MILDDTQILKEAYDAGAEQEYLRLGSALSKMQEFDVVSALVESLVEPGSVIIDIGSGPGRYAEHLLDKGHSVGCVDLSAKSLKLFSDRIDGHYSDKILFNTVSCATSLDWIESACADVILLMGPMYHLTEESDRQEALLNCHRILKPGGYLVVMYMSPYVLHCKEDQELLNSMEKRPYGVKTSVQYQNRIVPQFRCWPSDAAEEAGKQFTKLDIIEIHDNSQSVNVQGIINSSIEITAPQYTILFQSM